jgi:hypothetical protein
VSFWGVLPEKSIFYFSQLASAAPYLRDLSGIYAKDRYRMALIQYGDWFSRTGEYCLAVEQYNLAQNLFEDQNILPTVTFAQEQCLTGGESQTPTPESEFNSVTPTLTVTVDVTPLPTIDITITPTPDDFTPGPTTEITLTPTLMEPTLEPSPTETEVLETPTPSVTPEP